MADRRSRFVLFAADYASVPVIQCSPPSWMAHALLVEKAADHQVRWLDFARGEHKRADILALNPSGTIPILTEGDAVVTETLAILEYIEHRCPDPPLLPDAPVDRALALSRMHSAGAVKDAGMALFRALMRKESAESHWSRLGDQLSTWNAYLDDSAHLSGPAFGLADLCIFTYLAVAIHLGLDTTALPNLAAYHDRIRQRPSIRTTWPGPLGGRAALE